MVMMLCEKPFVKLFKSAGKCFCYDVNTNEILKIDEQIYNSLTRVLKYGVLSLVNESKNVQNAIDLLVNDGYLQPNSIKRIINPSSDFYKSCLHHLMTTLVLEVTENCNFRCHYCPYSASEFYDREHRHINMSRELAEKAIDLYFTHSPYTKCKVISFYGGEPLVNFDLIKHCVQYARNKCNDDQILFRMTTNGSLITEEMVSFFSDNSFYITISIDGDRYIHDKNRRFLAGTPSFDCVYEKIRMIHNMRMTAPIDLSFNAVWDGSVSYSSIAAFFENDPVLSNYSYEISQMSSNQENNYFSESKDNTLVDQYRKLKGVFCSNNNFIEKDFDFIIKRLKTKGRLASNCHHAGPCIGGQNKLYVTVDGKLFPCERFSHNCSDAQIGSVDGDFEYEKIFNLLNFGRLSEHECSSCWAIRLCSMCPVVANNGMMLSKESKHDRCTITKTEILNGLKSLCAYKYISSKS